MTFNASTLHSDWLGGLTVYFIGRATCSEFLARLKKNLLGASQTLSGNSFD